MKWKNKTTLRHKNVVSCKCKGGGGQTCSRTSLIFSAFLSLLAYSCTSSSPMSLVSLTRKVRPWSTVTFSVSLCPDKCFICWDIWGKVAFITFDIFRKLLMRFLVRLQGCVVISCGAKRLLTLKKTLFNCQICEVFPKWARYIMLGLSLSCCRSADCTEKDQVL